MKNKREWEAAQAATVTETFRGCERRYADRLHLARVRARRYVQDYTPCLPEFALRQYDLPTRYDPWEIDLDL